MARGWLRIYLGAAPGVGKTYAMLNEGLRRRSRGTDVVVGLVETHGRAQTAAQVGDLEVIPRRPVDYRDQTLDEMDVPAILERRPDVVLIDELAHTNIPGVEHHKRYEDVEELLASGINVISTLNLQHLDYRNLTAKVVAVQNEQRAIRVRSAAIDARGVYVDLIRGDCQIRPPARSRRKLNSSSWFRTNWGSNRPTRSKTERTQQPRYTVSTSPS